MNKAILVGLVLITVLAACRKDKTNACGNCPANISFKAVIIPIFTANCAVAGCHDAITHQFSLNFDSAHAYATATEAGTGYVIAGNATGSILYTELESAESGINGGMPPPDSVGHPALSACQVQDVECWINQGALNN